VYVGLDERGVVLTTEDGIRVTNAIVLEDEVLQALETWLKEQRERLKLGAEQAAAIQTVIDEMPAAPPSDPLAKPEGLSPAAVVAYELIVGFIRRHKLSPGGVRTFYSPAEWKTRGEHYLHGAELIIVCDGGSVKRAVLFAGEDHRLREQFYVMLNQAGFHLEEGEHWYAGVYRA